MANFLMGLLRALKLPVKMIKGWTRKRRKPVRTELENKQLKYVSNFSKKNISWQKSDSKGKKKSKSRKFSGKANNWTTKGKKA